MALTLEEERELRVLEEEEERYQQTLKGEDASGRVQARQKPQREARPFSIWRATIGSLRDTAQGLLDTTADVGSLVLRNVNTSTGLASTGASALGLIGGAALIASLPEEERTLPQPEGSEDAGTAERITRSLGSFFVPYVGAAKLMGVLRGASWLGRAGRAAGAGALVDFAQVDPVSGNMANFLRDTFGIQSGVLDALASEEDDDALWARFKAAATNAPVGIAADALFEAGFKAVKAYRAWKGNAEEAEEIVRAIRTDPVAEPKARDLQEPNPVADSPRDTKSVVESRTASGVTQEEPYDRFKSAVRENPPADFDDVLVHLRGAVGDVDTELNAAAALTRALAGDPENVLAKLGIDPAKLDFSKYDDPELLGLLLDEMTQAVAVAARGTGRTGIRVTEAATIGAARALATTADVLKEVWGNTADLAERLTAARLFVGAHAHKLLSSADAALAEIGAGGTGPAWAQFLADFHRHAMYVGTVRGASSEVGRALRSLQIVGKVSKTQAAKSVENAVQAENATRGVGNDVQRGVSEFVDGLVTDADKIAAINQLKSHGGDVGEIARMVRVKNMSKLKRVDAALRETVGNLFSPATAAYNLAAGAAMLGTKALSKGLAAVYRASLSPFGARHSMAARIHLMDAWAYTDGIITGFREAFEGTFRVLEKEGAAELSLNLDTLGLHKAAKTMSQREAKAADAVALGNYERTEVRNHRAFSITTAEQQRLRQMIQSEDGPTFFSNALAQSAKLISAPFNAAGSLSRLGTTVFINMPDQFIGTLAARAGARSEAVRLAASEAAELGLEGAELSRYLKARTIQLSEMPKDGWADDAFNAGKAESMARHGDAEAREALFQDDLEFSFNQVFANTFSQIPLMHFVLPFIKTPLRILERTALDFTPIGLVKERVRKAILAGGPEADEARMRMALGMVALTTAYQLAEDRTIIGSDGMFRSSARVAGRPSFSLRVGDDVIEFNRIDPVGTLLGFGADLRMYLDQADGDPEASEGAALMFEAAFWATTANILGKTWMTSLRNLTEVATTTDEDSGMKKASKLLNTFAVRFVPGSGFQRQVEKAGDGYVREADTFIDSWVKASLGASTLPQKRDHLLGRPVEMIDGDRLLGVRAGPNEARGDPLMEELEQLSFEFPAAKRSIEGVRMEAGQFNRWLELKGQVVRKEETGLTLEETLRSLIDLPEYQQLNRAGRVDAIRKEMEGFARLATEQLLQEDKKLFYRVLRKTTHDQLELQGASLDQKVAETRRLADELGIPVQE